MRSPCRVDVPEVQTLGATPAAEPTSDQPQPFVEPPDEPMPRDDALARAAAHQAPWESAPWYENEKMPAWLAAEKIDYVDVRRTLAAVARPCLEHDSATITAQVQALTQRLLRVDSALPRTLRTS